MVRLHGGTDFDEVRRIDTKLSYLTLGLDLGDGELAALRLGDILRLDSAGAELEGGIAVLLLRALAHDLAVLEIEHGHGDVCAIIQEQAGHAQLLCDQTRTHRLLPSLFGA